MAFEEPGSKRGTPLGRAPDVDVPSPSFDEVVAYLDAVRRGEDIVPPPGAGDLKIFIPLEGYFTSCPGAGLYQTFYSMPWPTHDSTELVASLHVDSFIGNPAPMGSILEIFFQTTVNGYDWFEDPAFAFTPIGTNTALPFDEAIYIDNIGAFGRFSVNFKDTSGQTLTMIQL